MIEIRSILDIADNTGAKKASFIGVLGRGDKQYAEIGDEVVLVGANNYLELWNKEQWEAEKAISQEQAWQIIESLERHRGV